jgi:hypothetical protein
MPLAAIDVYLQDWNATLQTGVSCAHWLFLKYGAYLQLGTSVSAAAYFASRRSKSTCFVHMAWNFISSVLYGNMLVFSPFLFFFPFTTTYTILASVWYCFYVGYPPTWWWNLPPTTIGIIWMNSILFARFTKVIWAHKLDAKVVSEAVGVSSVLH